MLLCKLPIPLVMCRHTCMPHGAMPGERGGGGGLAALAGKGKGACKAEGKVIGNEPGKGAIEVGKGTVVMQQGNVLLSQRGRQRHSQGVDNEAIKKAGKR